MDDVHALERQSTLLRGVSPVVMGGGTVRFENRQRDTMVFGVGPAFSDLRNFHVDVGTFVRQEDLDGRRRVAVVGRTVARELFGDDNPLGEYVRIGGERFQVIGLLEPKGRFLSFDLDDTAYIPVGRALKLFNRDELVEVDVLFSAGLDAAGVARGVKELLIARHGEEDFNVVTQDEMLGVLDRVLGIVSAAVGGIGAISLVVGAIGILTMMWIAVNERTAEIGLAKALGGTPGQIQALFLVQAGMLSLLGGVLGVAAGLGTARLLQVALPDLPVRTPPGYVVAALVVSLGVGLASGVMPARRAARLDPIEALHAE
jgi:putative ABC transport system permease protein